MNREELLEVKNKIEHLLKSEDNLHEKKIEEELKKSKRKNKRKNKRIFQLEKEIHGLNKTLEFFKSKEKKFLFWAAMISSLCMIINTIINIYRK